MRIASLRIENYGPFASLDEIRCGQLTTLVGQNDAGKSHVLRALRLFFEDGRLSADDIHFGARPGASVLVEVAFDTLPISLEFEDGTETSFQREMLLDAGGTLRLRRRWSSAAPGERSQFALVAADFADPRYAALLWVRERELAERVRADSASIVHRTDSVGSITTEPLAVGDQSMPTSEHSAHDTRAALRATARAAGVPLIEREIELGTRDPIRRRNRGLIASVRTLRDRHAPGRGRDDISEPVSANHSRRGRGPWGHRRARGFHGCHRRRTAERGRGDL